MCSAENNNVPEVEIESLYDLYNATQGPDWLWGQFPGSPWRFTADANPCMQWEGVECSSQDSDGYLHVVQLYLPNYNLVGSIPSSIANLTKLVNLTLQWNVFTGSTLPDSVTSLRSLKTLNVEQTNLSGSIPPGVTSMAELIVLLLGYNTFTGSIPQMLCQLQNLQNLGLSGCYFSGTIPSCLGEMAGLRELNLEGNILTGTVIPSLGGLSQLTVLDLGYNKLHGTLPTELAAISQLMALYLTNNRLTGTIPQFIGSFPQLLSLQLNVNYFYGTIPEALSNLHHLQFLIADTNLLTGTLPPSLTQLSNMEYFSVDRNQLSGTLPAGISNWRYATEITLSFNYFSGALPPAFQFMSQLYEVLARSNCFTGSLPDSFYGLTNFATFAVSDNQLTGTVPPSLLSAPVLFATELSSNYLTGTLEGVAFSDSVLYFSCAENHLSGPFPGVFRNTNILAYLNLSSNHLSGQLSQQAVSNLLRVNFLYLSDNLLSGTLPATLQELQSLSFLFMDENLLSGPLPGFIGSLPALSSLNMSNNRLSGTLPPSLAQLAKLNVLMLSSNRITGSIGTVFSGSGLLKLTVIQLNNNQLTGALPDSLAQLPSLQVFAAVSNCFEGSIPESLCSSGSLNTLALDGLQSATSCQYKLFPAALEGSVVAKSLYSIRNPLSGGVPSCLFGMGNLTTLHLSGNGLTGTIPADVSVSPALTDLSLSHNKLTGTIPAGVLQRDWANLDLSYNRLTGSLPGGNGTSPYSSSSALSLENNRLSGRMPGALKHVINVSVLEGNLFSCRADRSDLPRHDKYRDKYGCGSVTFDDAVYAWLALAFMVAVASVFLLSGKLKVDLVRLLRRWWAASSVAGAPHLAAVHAMARVVCQVAAVCACYTVVVLLPMYAVCSAVYGTYTHQYAWALSAAYLSGSTAFAWEFTCLAVLVVLSTGGAAYAWRKLLATLYDSGTEPRIPVDESELNSMRLVVYCAVVVLNFMVVLGVNTAYVIIALNQNGIALALAQIALALFKVAFNSACSPVLMRWACQRFLGRQPSAPSYVTLQLFVSVVNNILVPCLVVAVISPSCFYNVFEQAEDINAQFSYNGKCESFDPLSEGQYGCSVVETLVARTTYAPPFAYSYECSSSFITYYSPAFVIMCMVAGFGIPLAQVVLQRLHERAVVGSRWHAALDLVLPRILKPVHVATGGEGGAVKLVVRNLYAPFFDASQHVITLLTYLALLLTFGAVFPPLAVCFAVTVICMTVFTRLKVGRFLTCVSDHREEAVKGQGDAESERDSVEDAQTRPAPGRLGQGYVAVLEQECEGVGSEKVLGRSVAMVVAFSCVFYTLFLFDTLGDAVGLSSAYWVLIVVPLVGLLLGFSVTCTIATWPLLSEVGGRAEATLSPFAQEVEL
jgi:Leucine-rich repeat (LRR) protein